MTKTRDLANLGGGFIQAGTGAQQRTVESKLQDAITVEDFGAVGDGTTDDSAAFLAMLSATNGKLRLLDKEYLVNTFNVSSYDRIEIVGTVTPQPNAARTKLQNGSIIIGGINIRANDVYFKNFGLDFGPARTVTRTDGIVANAKIAELGNVAYIENVASLGVADGTLTHGFLIQGYEQNIFDNLFAVNHGYGVVIKGRQGIISNIRTETTVQSGLFIKGDTGASTADVGDGTAFEIVANNIISIFDAANTTGVGVYVQSATDNAGKVLINNVCQIRGQAPVYLLSGSTPLGNKANKVVFNNVYSEYAQYGSRLNGYVDNCTINNVVAFNPLTGLAITMGAFTENYTITNINLIIDDPTIVGTRCMEFFGTGSFDNITVQNSTSPMEIFVQQQFLDTVRTGTISGDCFITGEGVLTGINGTVVDATYPAKLKINPDSTIKLSGKLDLTAATNKFLCNLPVTTNKDFLFSCGGVDSTGTYVVVPVRLNSFQLSIEPSLPAGFQSLDLSNITFNM